VGCSTQLLAGCLGKEGWQEWDDSTMKGDAKPEAAEIFSYMCSIEGNGL